MDNSSPQAKAKGRIQNGFAAPYNFFIVDLVKESWAAIKGFKATYWGALGYCVLVGILSFLVGFGINYAGQSLFGYSDEIGQAVVNVVITLITLPLIVGMMMLAIRYSADLPVRSKDVFNYYSSYLRIFGVYVVQWVILFVLWFASQVFFELTGATDVNAYKALYFVFGAVFFLSFIYLAISYMFSLVLRVEKNYGIIQSLEVSRKAISQHWFKMIFALITFEIIVLLSAIPLLIGLIWTMPMFYIMLGILYRTMFGVEEMR